MIFRSLFGPITRFSTAHIGGLTVPPIQNLHSISLIHLSSSSLHLRGEKWKTDSFRREQVREQTPKGLETKGSQTSTLDDGGQSAESGPKATMSQWNGYQDDPAKEGHRPAATFPQQQQQQPGQIWQPQPPAYPTSLGNSSQVSNQPVAPWGGWNPWHAPQGYAQWNQFSRFAAPNMPGGGIGYTNNTGYGNVPMSYAPDMRDYFNSSRSFSTINQQQHNIAPPQKSTPKPTPKHQAGKKRNKKQQGHRSASDMHRDDIAKPSQESGGVPWATRDYKARASNPPVEVPEPRPLLVVIDLNGTLLFRPSRKNPTHFVERPHARKFLDYCIEHFHVAFWSSARPDNVKRMVNQLITPAQREHVLAIWGRDKFGLTEADYKQRTQCYKRLTMLWSNPEIASHHPDGGVWDQGNTVLIDDSIEKARSEPYNCITVPEFGGDLNETPKVLPLVHDYLNTLAMQADVSSYIKQNPFEIEKAGTSDDDIEIINDVSSYIKKSPSEVKKAGTSEDDIQIINDVVVEDDKDDEAVDDDDQQGGVTVEPTTEASGGVVLP